MLLLNVDKHRGRFSARLFWERPQPEPGIGCGSFSEYAEALAAGVALLGSLRRAAAEGLNWRPWRFGKTSGWSADIDPGVVGARVWQHAIGCSAALVHGPRDRGFTGLGRATGSCEAQALVESFLRRRLPALEEALALFALPSCESPHERLTAIAARNTELWDELSRIRRELDRLDAHDQDLSEQYIDLRRRQDMVLAAKLLADHAWQRAMDEENRAWDAHWADRHADAPRPSCDYCRAGIAKAEQRRASAAVGAAHGHHAY